MDEREKKLNDMLDELNDKLDKALAVKCIVDVLGSYTDLDIPYEREIAENILTKLSSVAPQETRWISVSERLPEDHKDVLAYLSSDRISICRYNSHKLPFSNNPIGWGYLSGIGFIDFKKEHVIAWMPLPKPYKAESEGKE